MRRVLTVVAGGLVAVGALLVTSALPAVALTETSLFTPSWVPNDSGNSSGLELGVRLSTSAHGYVTEIKFYKYADSVASHSGHVWNAAGTLLASVDFTNETASGWQVATLDTPIEIASGDAFTVSVFSTDYQYPDDGFPSPTSGPLAIDNGYYKYASQSEFPDQSVGKNYAVDLTFTDELPSNLGEPSTDTDSTDAAVEKTLVNTGADVSELSVWAAFGGAAVAVGAATMGASRVRGRVRPRHSKND